MKFNWSWQETFMFAAVLAAGVTLLCFHVVTWKELTGFALGIIAFNRPGAIVKTEETP